MKRKISAILPLSILCLMVLTAGTSAQEQAPQEPGGQGDPGVARISLMTGEVSTQRGDSGDWVAATVNAPVMAGDRVATSAHSRAEVQLDYADILRLNENSEVRVADLANNRVQAQVSSGLVDYVVFKGAQSTSEIDTPNLAVQPAGEGVYRIQVNGDGETLVAVRRGEAQISTPQGSATVHQGEMLTARGSTGEVQYRIDPAPGKDEWDAFNDRRDKTILSAQSYRYTNRYYTGASDLDQNGRWTYVPGYDWCWTPYVDSGWVPYTDGRWTWEPYYGWTWVSYEPWGWAPYHYGRWFSYNNAWAWWPGPVWGAGLGYQPIWAPAYVSFFGFGFGSLNFGFGAGFGFGSIGWLPIGPGDCFVPWYGRGGWGWGHGGEWGRGGWGRGGYYNHYNAVNITNVNNINNVTSIRNITGIHNAMGPLSRRPGAFSNLQALQRGDPHVGRAFSTVSSNRFGQGGLRGAIQHPGASSFGQGRLIAGGLPVVPTKASLSPSNRPVNSAAIPRNSGQQRFFTRQQPAAGPQPFSQHVAQIQQMVQHQNSLAATNGSRAGFGNSTANRGGNTPFQGANSRIAGAAGNAQNTSNTRRFETAPGPSGNGIAEQRQGQQGAQSRQARQGGWQQFGSRAPQGSTAQTGRTPSQAVNQGRTPGAFATRTGPGARTQQSAPNSGWQRFSSQPAPSGGQRGVPAGSTRNGFSQPAPSRNGPSPSQNRVQGGTQNQAGWRRFSGPAPGSTARPQGWAAPSRTQSNYQGSQSRPAPQSRPGNYGNSGWSRFSGGSGRPPLQLNKPIVTQRNSYGGGSTWGGRTSPRGNSGGYSAPRSYGGGYSAPRNYSGGYSAPRSYGGGYSAPRGGGGYSAPRGGGGGHSFGGGHSGGGSHGGRR